MAENHVSLDDEGGEGLKLKLLEFSIRLRRGPRFGAFSFALSRLRLCDGDQHELQLASSMPASALVKASGFISARMIRLSAFNRWLH